MNEFLPKELKDYIAQNQDTLVKLLDTLCRIPAPSNHEERSGGVYPETGLKKRAAKALTSTAP